MKTDIPEPIKQLLIDAVTDTLFFNEIAYMNQPFVVDVYHTYVSIPVRLVSASDIKKALKSETKLDEQMRFNICAALNLPADADKSVIIRASSTYLIIEIERDNPDLPTVLDLEQDKAELYTLGFAGDVHLQYRLFGNQEAGLACLGTTGSGKSNTIRLILALALAQGVECHLIDYKGGDSFREDIEPLCMSVAYNNDAKSMAVLDKIYGLVQSRVSGKKDKSKRVLLVFDELHQSGKKVQAKLALITSICRAANVRVLVGSQRFGKKIDADLRANITTRIVHRVGSKNESFNCCQVEEAMAERLPGKGAAIVVSKGSLKRVQIANAEPRFLAEILEKAREKREPKKTKPKQAREKLQQSKQKKTVRFVVKRLKEERERKGRRAKFPPIWAFYYARCYFQEKGEAPSRHYLNQERARVQKVTGEKYKAIQRAQTEIISEFCELWQVM